MISFVIFVVYLIVLLITFGKLPFTFFQQDEWAIFSNFIYWDKTRLDWFQRLFTYSKTHLIPLANLVSYFQFKLFGLHFFFYGVSAMAIHLINSLLVYYMSLLFTRKKTLAFLAGFLFLINSISHQGVTWVATTIGTAGSTFFILLSIIFFTKFVDQQDNKILYSIFSVVFLSISLLFKETSVFLFLFYPVFWFFCKKNGSFSSSIKFFTPLIILGFLYVLFRAFFLLFGFTSTALGPDYSQPGMEVYLYRVFSFPLKFIAQSILPQELIIKIADSIIMVGYPTYPNFLSGNKPNPYISQSVGADLVSYVFSTTIIVIIVVLNAYAQIKKEESIRRVLILSILFIAFSSFPFIFIPGRAGYFSLIEGRHLYISEAFSAILLVALGFGVYVALNRKRIVALVLIALYVVLSIFHIKNIRSNMHDQREIALVRKSILNKIYDAYPNPSKRVVFYIESDKPYYGLPDRENIVPFQSGFGQTLLVWYNGKTDTFPSCFFKDKYFYVLLNEGYRECEGRGFGYFRKKENLTSVIERESLSPKDIIAFKYNSSQELLKDITKDLREMKK